MKLLDRITQHLGGPDEGPKDEKDETPRVALGDLDPRVYEIVHGNRLAALERRDDEGVVHSDDEHDLKAGATEEEIKRAERALGIRADMGHKVTDYVVPTPTERKD